MYVLLYQVATVCKISVRVYAFSKLAWGSQDKSSVFHILLYLQCRCTYMYMNMSTLKILCVYQNTGLHYGNFLGCSLLTSTYMQNIDGIMKSKVL